MNKKYQKIRMKKKKARIKQALSENNPATIPFPEVDPIPDNLKASERLTGCGIIRDGIEYGKESQFRTHADVRASMGDNFCSIEQHGDQCGFWTDQGRFVDRDEASHVGIKAGQVVAANAGKAILSNQVRW